MGIAAHISKQGKDVLGTGNTYNDYIFNSDLNTFKIISQGTFLGTISSNPTTIQIEHNQGAAPAFYSFAKFPDGYVALPNEKERTDNNSSPNKYYYAEVDDTYIYLIFYKGTISTYNVTGSYFIFETPL